MTAQVFPFFFSPASTNFFSFPRLWPVSRWLTVFRLQLPVNLHREQQHKQLRPGNAFPPPLPGCFCAPTLVASCGLLAPQTTAAGRLASTLFSCRQSSPEQLVSPQDRHEIQCFGLEFFGRDHQQSGDVFVVSLSVIWLCHWPTVPLPSGHDSPAAGRRYCQELPPQLHPTLMRHRLDVRNTVHGGSVSSESGHYLLCRPVS